MLTYARATQEGISWHPNLQSATCASQRSSNEDTVGTRGAGSVRLRSPPLSVSQTLLVLREVNVLGESEGPFGRQPPAVTVWYAGADMRVAAAPSLVWKALSSFSPPLFQTN